MVHKPHSPPDEFDGKKVKGQTPTAHLDMAIDFDQQVRRIVDALKKKGVFENTLIVLTSDNGGLSDPPAMKLGYRPSGEWRSSKNAPFEGGHRVPFFCVWPGVIEPGISDELAVNQDMVATFAALVGTELPKGQAQDSHNLLPLLTGEGEFQSRPYWVNQAGAHSEVMLRKMPWKLIIQTNPKRTEFKPTHLYRLETDPYEKTNLINSPEHADVVKQLHAQYLDILKSRRPTAPGRQ